MLPDDELEQIRTDLETTLPDAGTVLSLTRTSDGQGGWSESWAGTTSVSCRLDFIARFGMGENMAANSLMPYTRAIVTLPHDTAITADNRFSHSSGTYNVIAVNLGSWIGVKRATLEKV